jgi:hypothetical protein
LTASPGSPPKILDIPLRIVAPESTRFLASVPDILGRDSVGDHALSEGFRKLNAELPSIINTELQQHLLRDGLAIPTAKVQQVVGDFLNQHRTLIDPNTGSPYRGLLGNVKKFEPDWNPDDFRAHLKEHLFEDMPQKPTRGR